MSQYALRLVDELHAPLTAALSTNDGGMMGTVLLCETLLSLLPSMSTKDMPYHLLREYNITPIDSGVMAGERHLSLSRFAHVVGGVLHVVSPAIHRVFVPLHHLPAEGRRQVVRMLSLLEEIKRGDGDSLADKCATILVKGFAAELLSSNLVPRRAVLMSASQLVSNGCCIHSIVSADVFVRKTFDFTALPTTSRLRDFLKTALDLCRERLLPAVSQKLLSQFSFVPRVILHDGSLSFSATSYCALSNLSLAEVRVKARQGTLVEEDCLPMLRAVEVMLLTSFELDTRLAKKIVK